MKQKPITVRPFLNRWYLYWTETNKTIASFPSQFEAYSARRAILQSSQTNKNV